MDMINQIFGYIDQYMFVLNIALYVILLIPIVFGFIFGTTRGFRKSIYHFIGKAIFYLVFIFTLELVAKALYNSSLFGLPAKLYSLVAHESTTSVVTFKDFFQTWGMSYAQSSGLNLESDYVYALFDMVGVFAFKIVWMIIYFIPINIIYHIILAIIFRTLVRGRVELRKITKDPLLGGVTGMLSGLISTFLIMVMLSGLFSLVRYTGEVRVQTNENPESAESTDVSYMIGDFEILLLDEEVGDEAPEGENSERSEEGGMSGQEAKMALEIVTQVARRLTAFTNTFYENKIVSTIDSITVKKELKGETESGEKYGRYSVLESTFDELVNMSYYYEDEEGNKIDVDINIVEEMNSVINAVLYVIDDDKIFTDDGKIDLTKVKGERIQEAFTYISEVQLLKVVTAVGVAVGAENYLTDSNGEKLSPSEINKLAMKDYTQDIKKIGGVFADFVDLGILSFAQDMMSGNVNQDTLMNDALSSLNGEKKEGETDEQYRQRVERLQESIADYFKDLEIVKSASGLIVEYVFNNMLKDFVEENGLDQVSKNVLTGEAGKSYVQNLIDSLDLAADIKLMVQTVFSVAGFNGDDDNVSFIMKNYRRLTEGIEAGETTLTLDDIANFMNSVLAKFSQLSFVNAGIDFAVKILTTKLEGSENALKEYLTEENIFGTGGIAWTNEIGEKIPNIINAVIKADILSFITNEAGPAQTFWNKSTEEGGLTAYLTDTVNALFALQVVSNLEDTCLKDLLTKYLDSMEMGISIKISDEIGTEGHKYKDEILTLIYLFDNLLDGARSKGATSFEDVFSGDTKYLLAGVAKIDVEKLDKSAILAPTIISFLSTWENDVITVPFIYEDKAWYSTYDNEGNRTSDGELFRLVNAIKVASNKEAVNNLITNGAADTNSLLDVIKSLSDDEVDSLFSSKTILCTIGKFLDTTDTGSFKIKVPGEAKELTIISNYKDDDTTITITSNNLKDKEGNDVLVDGNPVKLAEKDVIKTDEFKYIVKALRQINDFDSLMNSDNIISEFKKLKDNAIDEEGHETIYENDGITHKSKSDVVFESNILRHTIINYLATMENDNIIVPYIYEDKAWENTYDDLGNVVTKGEIYKLVDAILVVSTKDEVIDLINNGATDTNSLLDVIKTLSDDEVLEMFSSDTILCTLTKFMDSTTSGSFTIKVPENAKETIKLSKYKNDDTSVDLTTETLKDKDGNNVLVDDSVVYLGNKGVVKTEEFKLIVHALRQIDDFDSLMNSDNIISEFKKLKDNAIDEEGNETIYENDGITHKAKSDVVFKSSVLRATIINYLSTMESDNLIVPYIYEDIAWESEFDNLGNRTVKGELYNLVQAIMLVAGNDDVINLINNGAADTNSLLDVIKSLNDDETEALFSSNTIICTLTKFLDSTDTGTISIRIPNVAKEELYLSKYNPADTKVTTTSETLKDKENHDVIVNDDVVYLGKRDVIRTEEFKKVVKALNQVQDFNQFMNSSNIIGELTRLNGNAIDKDGNETIYKEDNITHMSKTEVLFDSEILRATISHFLTGDNFDKNFSYPYEVFDSEYYMKENDINSLFTSLFVLLDNTDLSNFEDIVFDNFKDLAFISNADLETLSSSVVLNATITDKLNSAFGTSSQEVIVPYNLTESTPRIKRVGDEVVEDIYGRNIKSAEIKALIRSVGYFDFSTLGDMNNAFGIIKDLDTPSYELGKTKLDVILESGILNATISDVIMRMSTDTMSIIVVEDAFDDDEFVEAGKTYRYKKITDDNYKMEISGIIDKAEITNLVKGFKYIDTSAFLGGDNIFNLLKDFKNPINITSDTLKVDEILKSKILKETISNYVIKLDVSSISINVPYNLSTLESLDPIANYSIGDNVQEEVYSIKKSELRSFIIAASTLDIDKLSSDPQKSVLELSQNVTVGGVTKEVIEFLLDSKIFNYSLSDYIVTKASSLGFAAITIPETVYSSGEKIDINVSSTGEVTKSVKYSINIDNTELVNLVDSIKYIDLNNIATNTLNVLSSLTTTELNAIEASDIMRFTLSSQVIDNAGSGSGVSYIVPKQSFELTSGSYSTYQIYSSFNENTGVITSQATKLVKMSEIRALIEVLNIIDLTNVTSEDVIRLSMAQLNTILNSNIVTVNISDKFKTSLQGNANVSSGYNSLMESDQLTYSATNDYANALTETITREEIANVFNSVKIMGVSDMSTFSVDVQTLYTLRDNGDNTDDDTQPIGTESRVDYLRSILFRTLLSQNVAFSTDLSDPTKCETTASDLLKPGSQAYLKVSTFTNTLDNTVFQGNVTTAPANLTLTNNTTSISWDESTYHYGDARYRVTYSIYLNGEKKYNDLTSTSNTDIMTLINGSPVGIYKVQVVGIGEYDYSGYGTWFLNAKPAVYDELEIRKEANLAMVTNVTQDETNVSITFDTVENANKYELVFTDLDDLSSITLIVKEKYSSTPVTRSLKNVLVAGHKYSFTIKPISNNEAYLSAASSIYSSPNDDPFFYKGELDQMIVEYSDNMLDFSNLENSITPTEVTYEITIGSDVYTYIPSDSTSNLYSYITIAEKYFALDLEALSNNNLINSGTTTFIVKAMRTNYKSSEASLDVKIYTNEFMGTYSVEEDIVSIDIKSSHIAEKYTVQVYRKSDDTIVMDKIFKVYGGKVSFSDSRLKDDVEYYVVITPYVAGNVYSEGYTFDYSK